MYDSRRPPEPGYPAINPSEADFTVDDEFEDTKCQDVEFEMDEDQIAEAESLHAPPGLVFFLQPSLKKPNLAVAV